MNDHALQFSYPAGKLGLAGLVMASAAIVAILFVWMPIIAPAAAIFTVVACFIAFDYRRGVILTLLFSPLVGTAIVRVVFINVTLTQLLLLVTIASFLGGLSTGRYRFFNSPLDKPLLGIGFVFLLVSIIAYPSIPEGINIPTATGLNSPELRSFSHLVFAVLLFGFYFLLVQYGSSYQRVNQLLNTFFISSSIVALYGIYQFVGSFFGFPLTDINQTRTEQTFLGSFKRIDATFPEPSLLSTYLMVALILLISLLPQRRFVQKIRYPAVIIHAIALFLSFGRTGWITFFISMLALLMFNYTTVGIMRQALRLAAVGIAIYFSLTITFSIFPSYATETSVVTVTEHLSNLSPEDKNFRYGNYGAAINMFKSRPLTGVGFENYTFFYESNKPNWAPYYPFISDSHNFYLQILAESGLVGMIALFWLIVVLFITFLKTRKLAQTRAISTLASGAAAAGIGLAFAFFNIQNIYLPFIWFLLAISMIAYRLALMEHEGGAGLE